MEKRRYIRFLPESNSIVVLTSRNKKDENILAVGLLRDESGHGCGAVFRKPFLLHKDDKVKAIVGKLFDLNGKIMWVKDIDEFLVKVGIYLE
ncbi:MAG: hypothetical protein PHF84_05640 [bacterium]|nr:hypothetical protein [bacterium]